MAKKTKSKKLGFFQKVKKDQIVGAEKSLIEELLSDMNSNRCSVYKINFVRGIFFGFGSVLGGTVIIAIVIWVLSQLGAVVPFLSDFIQEILDSLAKR